MEYTSSASSSEIARTTRPPRSMRAAKCSACPRVHSSTATRLSGCLAWIEQDYLRRIVLRERDVPDGRNV
jgi:hypothetical protein